MPSELGEITPIPNPQVPVINLRTGLMDATWYVFFKRMYDHAREDGTRLDGIDAELAALDARVTDLETP